MSSAFPVFKRSKVAEKYQGAHLHRLMPYRWSGHFQTTKSIIENYSEICSVLKDISSETIRDGDILVEATGLLQIVSASKFCFFARVVKQILCLLAPAEQQMQSRECDLASSIKLIDAAADSLEQFRTDFSFEKLYEEAIKTEKSKNGAPLSCKRPIRLNDSAIESKIGNIDETSMKAIFFETIDCVLAEIKRQYSNRALYDAVAAVDPKSDCFLDKKKLAWL